MARFKGKDLYLKDDDQVYFGDNQEAAIWFDGADLQLNHTVSGTPAIEDYHLIQKGQVKALVQNSGTLTAAQHEGLHDRDLYIEITRASGKITGIDEWEDNTKTKHISSTAVVRSAGKVVKTIKSIYDYSTGTSIIATVTGTITRFGNKITSVTYIRDPDVEGI